MEQEQEQEQNKVTWKLRFSQFGNTIGNGALNLGKGALNILSPLSLSLPSRTPGANTVAEELAKANRGIISGVLDKTWWGKAINILDGVGGATLGRTSATETGNFVTDGLNGFVSSMPILSTVLAPLGKTIDVYLSDRLKNSLSFNRQSVAMKNNGANVLFGKSSLSAEANLEGIRNAQAEQTLKLGDLDNAADALAVWHRQDMKLRGGPNRVNNFGVTGGKHGTVLLFSKRTLSKYKIRKHQSGGPVDLDAEYLKLIKDKNFLQDWNPDEESFRSYVEKRQTRDENDLLTDGNIYNNLYYFDITLDDYDMGKDLYLFFYDGSPYSFTDLSDARKAYNLMTPQEKRQFYINGMERSIKSGLFFLKGGQIKHKQTARTLDELVDYVEQQNPPFWERMSGQDKNEIPSPFGDEDYSTLLMSWSTGDNGMAEVYPQVQYDNTTHHLKYIQDWREALDLARRNGDVIIMTPEEAENFTTNYKKASKLKHLYDSILPLYTETFTGIFKEGGKVNVIPEGALHKNKHHLEDLDDKFGKDAITTKGIPVVVEAKDGEVIQLAEVERQEIIFRLEVTKKLEELSKKHTDEAAIEAGKLLVKEILYNTKDNTGEML